MKIILKTFREGYSTEEVESTMTAEEIIDLLRGFEPDEEVYLSFDNGYTYGGISEENFEESEE